MPITLAVALVLHALLILAVGFKLHKPQPAGHSIEVTLAQYRSTSPPEDSDYIAQFNQTGSGDAQKRQEITTDRLAPLSSPEFRETDVPSPAQVQATEQSAKEKPLVSAIAPDAPAERTEIDNQAEQGREQHTPQMAQEIASLRAKLAQQRQLHGKIPRTLVLTAASARAADQAEYLRNWIEWVEKVGNENYPEEARRKKIFGAIRLAVAVDRGGNVVSVEILQGSGQRVLDQAAIRIVRLAAPFQPIPSNIQEDRIEVIRTWNFVPGNLFSSSGD